MGRGQVYYRYRVGMAVYITSAFLLLLLALMVLAVRHGEPVVLLPLGIIFTGLLVNEIRHTASVVIRVDGGKLIYDYRAFLRHKHRELSAEDLGRITPDVISMWRGVITERLVMQTDDEELELVPIYSESDPDVQGIYDALNAVRAAAESRRTEQKRRREAAKAAEEASRVDPVWAVFELVVACPSCTGPVPVDGPKLEVRCPVCGEEIPLQPSLWSDVLEDVGEELRDMEEMEASKSHIMASLDFDLMYGRLAPSCPDCGSYLGALEGEGLCECPECGASIELRDAPDWLSGALGGADATAGPFPRGVQAETPPPPKGVRFNCPKCGAWEEIDGTQRICECSHCGLVYSVPDDLWMRFHPAPAKQRWFVRLVDAE